jgi:hypothetical protein
VEAAETKNELWLGKDAAAELMGASKRTFEREATARNIVKRTIPPGPGRNFSESLYLESDVRRVKAEREAEAEARESPGPRAVAVVQKRTELVAASESQSLQVLAILEAITARLQSPPPPESPAPPPPPPPPPAFAYLRLSEASALIRMPVWWIRAQIDSGRLSAERIGRSLRVRRCDLEALPARYAQFDGQ